jgi:hypothetical protein
VTLKRTKYLMLLKTACGCTQFLDRGIEMPPPMWIVPLMSLLGTGDAAQGDLFDEALSYRAMPRRRFELRNSALYTPGVVLLTYEEVPE